MEMATSLRELRTALSGLNASRIPTGVLLNRMMLITNPHRYAGQGDTVASYKWFAQQYWEFYHAALDSSQLPTLAALQASIAQRVQQGSVPLLMLSYSYNEFSATAAQDRLITIDSVNERVTDGPDLSRSPYTTGRFFSVALPVKTTQTTVAVYVGPEYWLGNTAKPKAVRIDFGDGQGVRSVAMGTTVQVRVNTGVIVVNPLRVRTTYQAGSSPLGQSLVRVTNSSTGMSAAATLQYQAAASLPPDVALGLVANRFWPGFTPTKGVHGPNGRATAIAWIKYAASNTTGKLRRPLVFVEGIDFDENRNALSGAGRNHYIAQTGLLPLSDFEGVFTQLGGYRNGAAGWNEMVDYNADYKSLEKFPALREQLQAPASSGGGDYDIIYFDFSDGASLIQDNAMVLAELLEWINQPANRAAGAEETMVIGASMGGQVARFALAWMEQQNLCHNSKLYVSFDSPHRGANVPLGIQHLFDRLQGVWIGSDKPQGIINNQLLREASMQMLNFHFSYAAVSYRTNWQAWQASAGSYPSLLRKVAIANGSGQAVFPPGTSPGMQLLHTKEGGFFRSFIEIVAGQNYCYALPGASSRGRNNVVFRYRKPYTLSGKWRYSYADPSWGNYDTAPGSIRRTAGTAEDESKGDLVADYKTDTFMPTISTLDVKDAGSYNSPNFGYNVQQQIPVRDQPNRTKYAFDAYFTANNINEPHVQITNGQGSTENNDSYYTDNSSWIQNELRESAHRMPAALTTVYNYGSPYRHLLPSVQINSGGQLYLNNGALPASGGTAVSQTIPAPANFEVYTSSCPTVVQVNSGGRLLVGTTSAYPASLRMSANSLLDLRAGSRIDVSQDSVLRIVAGATLVVRSGAALNVAGQVIVEAGAYLCVENPANIVTTGSGTYTVSPAANFSANPALNLGTLACNQPGVAPLQVSITSFTYLSYCTSSTGRNNYGQWTATASGGTGVYSYAWYLDTSGTGNSYSGPYSSSTSYGTCLGSPGRTTLVKVVVTSGSQQASAAYYGQAQSMVALFPNPADTFVDVANVDESAAAVTQASSQAALAATTPAAAASEATSMQVTVYNGQGKIVYTAAGTTAPSLRLNTQAWPAGLYQVAVQRGKTITRRQLSVQH